MGFARLGLGTAATLLVALLIACRAPALNQHIDASASRLAQASAARSAVAVSHGPLNALHTAVRWHCALPGPGRLGLDLPRPGNTASCSIPLGKGRGALRWTTRVTPTLCVGAVGVAALGLALYLYRRARVVSHGGASRGHTTYRAMAAVGGEKQMCEDYEQAIAAQESRALYKLPTENLAIDTLFQRLEKEKLNLLPEYQRGYVWDPRRASRLIVTVLCNRFVPELVLHEKTKGVYDVVDGKQRLTSILSWYAASKSTTEKARAVFQPFAELSRLEDEYEAFNGLKFEDLSKERQDSFEGYTLKFSTIPYNTSDEEVYAVYEDINSGSADLTPQQLRRAAFYGPYISQLDLLAKNDKFQRIRKKYVLDPKEGDRELILRAFAIHRGMSRYKPPLKLFLNAELKRVKEMSPEAQEQELKALQWEFGRVMEAAWEIFEGAAFRKWERQANGQWGWATGAVSTPLWDALYSALASLVAEHKVRPMDFQGRKAEIKAAIQDLFETGALEDLSKPSTAPRLAQRRDLLRSAVQKVLQPRAPAVGGRAFPREYLREKYDEQRGLCPLCGQTIREDGLYDGTYAQLDHIVPHAKGGPTTKQNCQLVHATCNASKGARGP